MTADDLAPAPSAVLPCGCPIAPRTAAEFRAAAACPSTWDGDVAGLVRMAERLARRAVSS